MRICERVCVCVEEEQVMVLNAYTACILLCVTKSAKITIQVKCLNIVTQRREEVVT